MSSSYQKARDIAERSSIKKNLFVLPGFSFDYIKYRILRPLIKYRYKKALGSRMPAPWMSIAAIQIFEAVLNKNMKGFEFGSGNSTLFFAKRVQHIVSLEHDKTWFSNIKNKITQLGLTNIDYHLIEPDASDKPPVIKKRNDDWTVSSTAATCYVNYYTFIDRQADESFDFIIVDGRARVECAQHALSKLKKGGILILDNSERLRYKPVHEMLADWPRVNTTNGLTDTTFWFKPEPR